MVSVKYFKEVAAWNRAKAYPYGDEKQGFIFLCVLKHLVGLAWSQNIKKRFFKY